MLTVITFIGFTAFVAFYAWYKLRKDTLDSSDSYFLGGRSLTGVVIAGSMLLTNISTEHLIGMNGSSYKNGFIIIGWEVTSALALVVTAIYFIPKYLRMGLTTIPEYFEKRFSPTSQGDCFSNASSGGCFCSICQSHFCNFISWLSNHLRARLIYVQWQCNN